MRYKPSSLFCLAGWELLAQHSSFLHLYTGLKSVLALSLIVSLSCVSW